MLKVMKCFRLEARVYFVKSLSVANEGGKMEIRESFLCTYVSSFNPSNRTP